MNRLSEIMVILLFLPFGTVRSQWIPVISFPDSGVSDLAAVNDDGMIITSHYKYIYKLRDIAGPWSTLSGPWDSAYTSVYNPILLSNGTILACADQYSQGEHIFIWKSTNGGSTWLRVTEQLKDIVYNVLECGPYVLATVDVDSIFRTSDWGTSWRPIFGFPRYHERKTVSMTAIGEHAFAQMYLKYDPPHLFRTTDYGLNWTRTNYWEAADQIIAVGSRLFAEAPYLGVWYSDDEGDSWHVINAGLSDDSLHILALATDGRNLFATAYKTIYMLPAGGGTWMDIGDGLPQRIPPWDVFSRLSVFQGNLYAGIDGLGSTITYVLWRRPLDQIIEVHRVPDRNSGQIEIHSLAPNPFFTQTALTFTLPRRVPVLLTLHDVLGRTIRRVVDEVLDPGEHSIPVQATDLLPGVYYYRLSAEGNVKTGKMVLVR